MAERNPSRRGFLKAATVALGGAIGAVLAVPLVRYLLFPLGRATVSAADEPIDVAAADEVSLGAAPLRVQLRVPKVADAWAATRDVPRGAAYLVRDEGGEIKAFSSACPHLGCAVDYHADAGVFQCPCHDSAFAARSGDKLRGPAKRGLDPLPVAVEDGRVKVRFKRFRTDVAEREEV
jgi:Rieske Fe-S protein